MTETEPRTAVYKLIPREVDPVTRVVSGWAYVCNDANGNPVVDVSGEHIPFSELELMPPPWANGPDTSGTMHADNGPCRIIGWFPLGTKDRAAFGFGDGVIGAMCKMRVVDDAAWARVTAGELPALSIEGSAIREPV